MNVTNHPFYFQFSHSAKADYTGGRTKDTIVDWMKMKTGAVSLDVSDCAQLTIKVNSKESKLGLSYFGPFEGSLYDEFIKAAWDQSINEKFHFY